MYVWCGVVCGVVWCGMCVCVYGVVCVCAMVLWCMYVWCGVVSGAVCVSVRLCV